MALPWDIGWVEVAKTNDPELFFYPTSLNKCIKKHKVPKLTVADVAGYFGL